MKTNRLLSLTLILLLYVSIGCYAQKPRWINNTPKELNHTYKFVSKESKGRTLEEARASAILKLKTDEKLIEGIRIQHKTIERKKRDKTVENKKLKVHKENYIIEETEIDGEPYYIQAQIIDEYITESKGIYTLQTLFAAATCEDPVFDRTYISTSYGATPVLMSVIPGLGQFYKGSTLKGVCMLAGVAACGVGALFCENERSDYKNKMKEQPQFAQKYNTKANNYETARNICLGAAAAVWIYNIIDAAAAKGARKIIVKPASGSYLSVHPVATPHEFGVSLAYNF